MQDTTEYLVRDGDGKWEICHCGVFRNPEWKDGEDSGVTKFITAWATRCGAFFCSNEDAGDVQELPE